MADLASPSNDDPLAPSSEFSSSPASSSSHSNGYSARSSGAGGGDSSRYGQELHSVTIRARQRTFYIDLKQSAQGKFVKLSEKSRGGQKTTIIFDIEDLPKFIEALQEMQAKA